MFILQKYALDSIHRMVASPLYSYSYQMFILLPDYQLFKYSTPRDKPCDKRIPHRTHSE